MSQNLQTVVALQQALTDLDHAQERLTGIPEWMRELHEEYTQRKEEIAALEQAEETAAHERRAAEAAIEDAQVKLRRYQEQINQVTTQREYGALLQEIDTAKHQVAELEEQALAAVARREEAQQALAAELEAFHELDQRYNAEMEKWEAEKPGVARQVEELEQQVEELKGGLPRPLLSQFLRILEHHQGEALAPVRSVSRGPREPQIFHCGVCNYRVRPQVVVDIRNNGVLLQCESCKRILYVVDEEQN
jgi:uncharacterized protein